MSPSPLNHISATYRIRLLACTAAALLVVIGAVHFWPVDDLADERRPAYRTSKQEAISIEAVLPTRQAHASPVPPRPPVPILVPDAYVLDDPDLDVIENVLPTGKPGDGALSYEGEPDGRFAQPSGPTVGPKTVRFVEPEYPREARRRHIRAELVVRVLVDAHGRVQHAEIIERFLLDGGDTSRTPVDVLGYGLEEATLSAADRWMFRPARKNGEPVASHTELTFTFGTDA